jgi:ornithine cyclodeaminase/alanine dehydrogenase-like protein (mu-crystallin family)
LKIVQDQEVRERFDFSRAIQSIEDVMRARAEGRFSSPARHYEGNEKGDLAFTIGGDQSEGLFGFRVYPRFQNTGQDSQFTAVYDATSGQLRGMVFGDYLGAARTGAIGGVAVKYMTPKNVANLGVLGTGLQAETQIRAICAVRTIAQIKVFSRSQEKCFAFAQKISATVGVDVKPVSSPEHVLDGAEILVTATTSRSPILGVLPPTGPLHVNAIGPKFKGASELPGDAFATIEAFATDSPDQLAAYKTPAALQGARSFSDCADLAHLVAGSKQLNAKAYRTMFLSVGLAGTEPKVAEQFL